MKDIPGIISVIGGDADAFSSVLPTVDQTIEPTQKQENPVVEGVQAPEQSAPAKESTAYILASALKESGLDLGEIKPDMALSDFTSKITNYLDSNVEAKAKELYGEDTIEAAKMLNSGMSLENRTEYARLQVLANHKYEITDDMTDDEKDAVTNDAKEVIKEYYSEKLSGKMLQNALNSIDEYDEEFAQMHKDASDYFKNKRDEFKQAELSKIESAKNEELTYDQNMRKAIEAGTIYGDQKMSHAEIALTIKNIYEPTEEIELNGKKTKVSKYVKMVHEIKKDPAKGAMLAAIVAEGLDLRTAKNIGKGDFAAELEKKLKGAMDFPGHKGGAVVGEKMPLKGLKGIVEVLN